MRQVYNEGFKQGYSAGRKPLDLEMFKIHASTCNHSIYAYFRASTSVGAKTDGSSRRASIIGSDRVDTELIAALI